MLKTEKNAVQHKKNILSKYIAKFYTCLILLLQNRQQ